MPAALDQLLPCVLIDFETRARVDLIKHGGYNYCRDPDAAIIALTARICTPDNREGETYTITFRDQPGMRVDRFMKRCREVQEQYRVELYWVAHNADSFDMLVFDTLGFIDELHPEVCAARAREYGVEPKTDQWVDSATIARMHGLPARLGNACRFLKIDQQKNEAGQSLIDKFSKPGRDGEFAPITPADLAAWREYVTDDVDGMWGLLNALPEFDLEGYIADATVSRIVNHRGLCVDAQHVTLARKALDLIRAEANTAMHQLTHGAVERTTQIQRLKTWMGETLTAAKLQGVWNGTTQNGKKLDKATVKELLPLLEAQEESEAVNRVLDALDLLALMNKAALSKYDALYARVDDEWVLRYQYVHAGAGQTWRYSSRGVQIHNLIRKTLNSHGVKQLQKEMRRMLHAGTVQDWSIVDRMSYALRPTFIPDKGNMLVVADWSNIEGRLLPWLAGTRESMVYLEQFRTFDKSGDPEDDPYNITAAQAGHPGNRQIGKVALLSLGYGGAVGAFQGMAANYGVQVRDSVALGIVQGWRHANQWAVRFWRRMFSTAVTALRRPGDWLDVPADFETRIRYRYLPGSHNGLGALQMHIVHADTTLFYCHPRLVGGTSNKPQLLYSTPARVAAKSADKWPSERFWHGLAVENATQAGAGALLRHTMRRPSVHETCVMHTHDEIGQEQLRGLPADKARQRLGAAMTTNMRGMYPGLPLAVEVNVLPRYMKAE